MTAIEVARIACARQTPRGWVGRCPSHDDRRPSFSIFEGRDGRVLLKCFAGCEPAAIASALGLKISDLFVNDRKHRTSHALRSVRPRAADVEAALQAEVVRIVTRESARAGFEVATLTRHRNGARSIMERRFGVRLHREHAPWHQVEPHALDPAWESCIDRVLDELSWELEVERQWLVSTIGEMPALVEDVLRRARLLQRELALSEA